MRQYDAFYQSSILISSSNQRDVKRQDGLRRERWIKVIERQAEIFIFSVQKYWGVFLVGSIKSLIDFQARTTNGKLALWMTSCVSLLPSVYCPRVIPWCICYSLRPFIFYYVPPSFYLLLRSSILCTRCMRGF